MLLNIPNEFLIKASFIANLQHKTVEEFFLEMIETQLKTNETILQSLEQACRQEFVIKTIEELETYEY